MVSPRLRLSMLSLLAAAGFAATAQPAPSLEPKVLPPSPLIAAAEGTTARLLLCARYYGARYASEATRLEDALIDHVEKSGRSLDAFGPPHQRRVVALRDELAGDRRNAVVERCETALQDSEKALAQLRGDASAAR